MELVEAYQKMFAGSLFPSTLLEILAGRHPFITVTSCTAGVMVLSNGQVITCAGDYYKKPNAPDTVKSSNPYITCRSVRRNFDIEEEVPSTACKECHATCIQMCQEKLLERKKRKKRRRRNQL